MTQRNAKAKYQSWRYWGSEQRGLDDFWIPENGGVRPEANPIL
jgi:hypothetical protein